ncbi:uncharacterized protein LOC131328356 [Rhododendron vialii]|uniref:uncharacterized protein LOC131328356 n=1 Tax=Rhododendron vialii TaxID=182163 RepID=UPI00265FC6BC|nr:uncharacterized protein LOC131328356 [Rhododendron vialii]
MEKPVLTRGMKFPNAVVFRKALREWQVQGGYDLEFVKNESSRVTTRCKGKYGFRYINKLRDDPCTKVDSWKKEIRRKLVVNVSKWQLYGAKKKARDVIDGDITEEYNRLYDYIETGYGPMIGPDGAFLKGMHKGQLLSAVGRDENDNMFSIAIVVVEAEIKDSWRWFLELLMEDIGIVQEKGWGFISDRQKGLLEVFKEFLPNAEHKYCMRHLYANFRKLFRGKELKDAMWRAASTGTV